VDLKIQKFLMLGSNTQTVMPTNANVTDVNDSYTSGVGFEGRFAYHWKDNKYFIFDLANLPASQAAAFTGTGGTGTPTISDSILTVNVGIQIPLIKPIFGLKPYVAGALGYAKLSGTITGTVSGAPLTIGYGASGFDLMIEGGLVKEFSPNWSAVGSLGFTYEGLSPTVNVTNLAALPLTTALAGRSYSHLTISFGGRYSF
jgi:hypothetical protein